jgi:hypothetical protein
MRPRASEYRNHRRKVISDDTLVLGFRIATPFFNNLFNALGLNRNRARFNRLLFVAEFDPAVHAAIPHIAVARGELLQTLTANPHM